MSQIPTNKECMKMFAEELEALKEREENACDLPCRMQKLACNLANFLRKNDVDMAEFEKFFYEFEEKINTVMA